MADRERFDGGADFAADLTLRFATRVPRALVEHQVRRCQHETGRLRLLLGRPELTPDERAQVFAYAIPLGNVEPNKQPDRLIAHTAAVYAQVWTPGVGYGRKVANILAIPGSRELTAAWVLMDNPAVPQALKLALIASDNHPVVLTTLTPAAASGDHLLLRAALEATDRIAARPNATTPDLASVGGWVLDAVKDTCGYYGSAAGRAAATAFTAAAHVSELANDVALLKLLELDQATAQHLLTYGLLAYLTDDPNVGRAPSNRAIATVLAPLGERGARELFAAACRTRDDPAASARSAEAARRFMRQGPGSLHPPVPLEGPRPLGEEVLGGGSPADRVLTATWFAEQLGDLHAEQWEAVDALHLALGPSISAQDLATTALGLLSPGPRV